MRARATSASGSSPALSPFRSAPDHLYEGQHWFACRTRPRAEKKAARMLEGSGVESYLPLVERERQWADRTKRVEFPLFPGYVFARFALTEMHRVLRVPSLAHVVRVNGYPTPVRRDEIDAVRKLVETANETGVEPEPVDFLEPGEEIVVVDGPFAGMRGVLVERRGRARVAVKLSAIRQAVSVEMDRRHLKPAAGRTRRYRTSPPGGRPRRGH